MIKMRDDIYLREAAWRFLLEQNISRLPISSSKIAKLNGYKLISYTEFAAIINKPFDYLVSKYDNDGFVFWSEQDDCFIICYNENLENAVIRWTIMHEIAHIVLRHVGVDAPALTRVRKIEHPQIEKEADGFVRRVLCPSIVLHECNAVEVEDIMRLCGVSKTAAEFRSRYMKTLEQRNKWRMSPYEVAVEAQFKGFINGYCKNTITPYN